MLFNIRNHVCTRPVAFNKFHFMCVFIFVGDVFFLLMQSKKRIASFLQYIHKGWKALQFISNHILYCVCCATISWMPFQFCSVRKDDVFTSLNMCHPRVQYYTMYFQSALSKCPLRLFKDKFNVGFNSTCSLSKSLWYIISQGSFSY